MPLWLVFVLFGLVIKLPIAVLMLWIPMRSDAAMAARDEDEARTDSEDEGGSKVPPRTPTGPHPRLPRWSRTRRRGPHGGSPTGAPTRIRSERRRVLARSKAR